MPRARKTTQSRPATQRISAPQNAIISVSISKLFGQYDYEDIRLWGRTDTSNIAFFYGDNGVGKTTILRLLFELLTPEPQRGHKGIVARTKFASFKVTLGDGQTITAKRPRNSVWGSYSVVFEGPRVQDRLDLQVNSEGRVLSEENPNLEPIYAHLRSLAIPILYVTDDRLLKTTLPFIHDEPRAPWFDALRQEPSVVRRKAPSGEIIEYREAASTGGTATLDRLIRQTSFMLLSQAFTGSSLGERGASQVYLEVARAIARSAEGPTGNPTAIKSALEGEIRDLQKVIPEFERFGIPSGFGLDSILKQIHAAPNAVAPQLGTVLRPYVESIKQRVEANRPVLDLMSSFESIVNSFLRRKHIELHLSTGIVIRNAAEEVLAPSALSSGERHLLFLTCSALLSRERPTIILIDEPELSLNPEWQKKLVKNLNLLSGPQAQYIMATHSFEIISAERSAVAELEP